MADQLQFRGGTTSEVSAASVASREIIIDTQTTQIVVGTSKKKTVMEDSSGNVAIGGGNIQLNADGSATFAKESLHKVVSFSPNQDAPYLIAATTSYDGTTTNSGTYGYQYKYKIDAGGTDRISIDTRVGEVYSMDKSGNIKLGGTLPASPNISLNADGSATFGGIVNTGLVTLSSTTTSGVNQNPAGQLVVQRASSSGSSPLLWRGYSGNTQTSSISAGGSAKFDGSVSIGGTAAANTIDEYEEGAWTPIVVGASVAGTVTYGSNGQHGKYTRIGKVVCIEMYVDVASLGGATGATKITGLPFNADNTQFGSAGFMDIFATFQNQAVAAYTQHAKDFLFLRDTTGGSLAVQTGLIKVSGTYLIA